MRNRFASPLALGSLLGPSPYAKSIASHDWSHTNGLWIDNVTYDDGTTGTFAFQDNGQGGQPGTKV